MTGCVLCVVPPVDSEAVQGAHIIISGDPSRQAEAHLPGESAAG